MIRFISCMRKREGITQEEFRGYWNDQRFDELIRKNAEIFQAKSFAKNLTLLVPFNFDIRHARSSQVPFDGIIEYWWDNARSIPAIEEVLVCEVSLVCLKELNTYQEQLIDIKQSHFFFTEQKNI